MIILLEGLTVEMQIRSVMCTVKVLIIIQRRGNAISIRVTSFLKMISDIHPGMKYFYERQGMVVNYHLLLQRQGVMFRVLHKATTPLNYLEAQDLPHHD